MQDTAVNTVCNRRSTVEATDSVTGSIGAAPLSHQRGTQLFMHDAVVQIIDGRDTNKGSMSADTQHRVDNSTNKGLEKQKLKMKIM